MPVLRWKNWIGTGLALGVLIWTGQAQVVDPVSWVPPTPRPKATTPFAPKPFKGDNIFTGDAEGWLADAIISVEMGKLTEILDQSVKDYVSAVGQNLLKYSRDPTKKVQFVVLDGRDSDAFSVGGGKIYITLGMLNELPNEDELAAVLGHELGHDIFHHAGLTVTRQLFWMKGKSSIKSAAETVDALTKLDVAYEKNALAMIGEAFLGFQRAEELEADRAAFYNIYKAGYNPSALKHFMTDDVLAAMLRQLMEYKDRIDSRKIMPRVRWK